MGLLVSNPSDACSCSNSGPGRKFYSSGSTQTPSSKTNTWALPAGSAVFSPAPHRMYALYADENTLTGLSMPNLCPVSSIQQRSVSGANYPLGVIINYSLAVNNTILFNFSNNANQWSAGSSLWTTAMGLLASTFYPGNHEWITDSIPILQASDVLTETISFTAEYSTASPSDPVISRTDQAIGPILYYTTPPIKAAA